MINKRMNLLCIIAGLLFISVTYAAPSILATTNIRILGPQVDLDTRPDVDGLQNTMTAVKNIPTGVQAFVGVPGTAVLPVMAAGVLVKAELSGPALGNQILTLSAAPNQLMEIPSLGAAGDYRLFNVRLEGPDGRVLLRRDPIRPPVVINVIDKLLVTQVTSRPLTLDEIQKKGIVIDESNFTALNFTIGLTLGSEQVQIELPVAIPTTQQAAISLKTPEFSRLPVVTRQFDKINIPNFSISGFSMRQPPELKSPGISIPPINGIIVIPGNIAFLNQFFSVILQATNVAPDGSGLNLRNAQATIALPLGGDKIKATGDDPLRIAKTQTGGIQEVLPLVDSQGNAVILPQGTNQAEFLVEGLKEGTHAVNFAIKGDLFVPALGKTVVMAGVAAGVVQVKNPTFSMVLAHPDVVREGETYSLFATVTNTSSSPANLFKLKLNSRSLSGARLADGESDLKTLDFLAPGEAESFEFRLVARTTGQVTGTVFLADEGINGSFILNTGVGDTGIPLSPDTLVLPQTVDYLPKDPGLVFAAVRMLGQAYSVATAPAGALPPEIARINRGFVFDRAVKVAQAGLHVRFGESPLAASEDILMDFLGNDLGRLAERYPADPQRAADAEQDLRAFDGLRRAAEAGHHLSDRFAVQLGKALVSTSLPNLQQQWAERFASRPAQLSFAMSSRGPPVHLQLTDADGQALGHLAANDPLSRDIPFADRLKLTTDADMLFVAAPESASYLFEFVVDTSGRIEPTLVLPIPGGMEQIRYPEVNLPAGAFGRMAWTRAGPNTRQFEIDINGDGVTDQTLAPLSVTPIIDVPPTVLAAQQWGKGAQPGTQPSFESGDPIGRMVGVLFSEEVDVLTAERLSNFSVSRHETLAVSLQTDHRLAFVVLDKPVGPFVPRDMDVTGASDLRGHVMSLETHAIVADPDRGIGGRFSGTVVGADGHPIPFATVKYLQPLSFKSLFDPCFGDRNVRDFVIATYQADAQGQFNIDYVLQADFPTPECPSNPDVWLNENNAQGSLNFKLEALDPETGEIGKASSRIQFDGQKMDFNVIIRGFGAIEGDVFDEAGQLVVGGDPGVLTVIARNISTGEAYASWVDANGHYAFPRTFVGPGGAGFDAPRPAVGNLIVQIIRPADGFTAVATVNIPAADTTVQQDLIMISPTHYGTVTGRVFEADGKTAAANIPVQIVADVLTAVNLVSRTFTPGVVGSVVSDNEGFFRFENVQSGDIELRAFRQSTFEQASAKSFLSEGALQHVSLILPGSGGSVRGFVRDALNNPVAGATVAGGPTLTKTDAKGFFEIKGLPVGAFTIYGQGSDSPALGQVNIDALGPNDVQDIVITLQAVGSIMGTVFEADGLTPVVAQKVQLWTGVGGSSDGVMAETFTRADGRYEFKGFPLKNYAIRAVRANYGDGGQALTSLRFAGDVRDADITFRGLGEIKGRVLQSNGTPALTDVIITRKVWRIVGGPQSAIPNPYLDFVTQLGGVSQDLGQAVDRMLAKNNLNKGASEFFFLVDEPVRISSDILGPVGEVTGRFDFTGAVTGGPFTVAAFGPLLSPAELASEIPLTTLAAERIVDIGDIILQPATGHVKGTVYMPDNKTPAGANIRVKLRSLDASGDIKIPAGIVTQPVLPEIDVLTDINGQFDFPLVLRGRFVLTVDTGVADPLIRAHSVADINTRQFADVNGNRQLNVRLYGQTNGVVPRGETLDIGVRLQDVAGVRVHVLANDGVTPVPFAEVTLNTASGLDTSAAAGFVRQISDANGLIDFFPVIEGRFSISARNPSGVGASGQAKGQVSGEIPINPDNGYQAAVVVTLGAVTTATGQVVQAQAFGSVAGTVFMADGRPLANPGQVTVSASGIDILTTSDATGHYRADNVPAGRFSVAVFEPFTARRGSASGRIAIDGQIVTVPVTLVGLGTVTGEVFNHDGSRMLSGVDVLLFPSGNFSDRLVSRTNALGIYRLPGVPLGRYQVKANDLNSGLTGEQDGAMLNDGDINTTNVFLEAAGRIAGTLYAPGVLLDTAGQPVDANGILLTTAPRVAGARVSITGAGFSQVVQTDANGSFISGDFLKTGRYTLTARPIVGQDGATATTTIDFHGQLADVAMVLRGQGVVEGVLLDSLGLNPVASARVTLQSRSPFSTGAVTRFTDVNGVFRFVDIPVGQVSLSVQTTLQVPQLGGAISATLLRDGQTLSFRDDDSDLAHAAIHLQAAGEIRGQILLPDGVRLAQGAIVELHGGGIQLSRISDSNGQFAFLGVPLQRYTLSVREPVSNGVAARVMTLLNNGQLEDLGQITLDNQAPAVVSALPDPDSAGAVPTAPILITFGELIDPVSVNAQTFQVFAGGRPVTGSLSVSAVMPVVSFTPVTPFSDLTTVKVTLKGDRRGFEGQVLAPGIRDLSGIGMITDFSFSFMTADTHAPVLQSISPVDQGTEVALNSVLRLEFSEPVKPSSIQSLTLMAGGLPVAGQMNVLSVFSGRVVVFTPNQPLLPNQAYQMTLQGPVMDLAGNVMPQSTLQRSFTTIDTLAPIIQALAAAPGVPLVQGGASAVTATIDPLATDVASVEFFVAGQLVDTALQAPYTTTIPLNLPATRGILTVRAVAIDQVGNRSLPVELPLNIARNVPPVIRVIPPLRTVVSVGQRVTVHVVASDDLGLSQIRFSANDGSLAHGVQALPAVASAEHDFDFLVPTTLPVGSTIRIQAVAQDTQNQTGQSAALLLTVEDKLAPVVQIGRPTNNSAFDPGATVSIFIRADDSSGIDEISLEAAGVMVSAESRPVTPASSPASGIFTLHIPPDALPTAFLSLTARARDRAGNIGQRSIALRINDRIPPRLSMVADLPTNLPTNLVVEPGGTMAFRLLADDEMGVTQLAVAAPGIPAQSRILAASQHIDESFSMQVPADIPLGTQIILTATAEDAAGNRSAVATLTYVVTDLSAPSLTILAPVAGDRPKPGASLAIQLQASDPFGVARLDLTVSGAASLSDQALITPAKNRITQVFHVLIPADAVAGTALNLQATATDVAGNVQTLAMLMLKIADIIPPQVIAITPADGAIDVDAGISIQVDFDEPVLPASVTLATVKLTAANGVAVRGHFLLSNGNRHLRLTPDTPLTLGASYTLDLTPGVTDLAGNALLATRSRFSIVPPDTTPPHVVNTVPANAAAGVLIAATLDVTFSEAMDPATVNATSVHLRPLSGVPVGAQLLLSADGLHLTVTPNATLALNTAYELTLGTALTDLVGNGLAANYLSRFQTETGDIRGPVLLELTPLDGATGVSVTPVLQARFDEALKPVSMPGPLLLRDVSSRQVIAASMTQSSNGQRLSLRPNKPLAFAHRYQLELTAGGLSDVAGNQVTDASGTALTVVQQTWTTGSFAMISPLAGSVAIEKTRLVLQAGTGITLADVVFEVNGVAQSPVVGPLFQKTITVPALTQASHLQILARGRDAAGTTIAQDLVTVAILPAMRLDPGVLGIAIGGHAPLHIQLSSALSSDLALTLQTGDPAIASLTGPRLVLPAGVLQLDIPVNGLAAGNTTIQLDSILGSFSSIASVSAPLSGQSQHALARPIGVSILPPLGLGRVVIPATQNKAFSLPFLAKAAAQDMVVTFSSSDPAVARVPANVVIAAGSLDVGLTVNTGVAGTAHIILRGGGQVRELIVIVGTPPAGSLAPALARPVGISILPPASLGAVVVPLHNAKALSLSLLPAAATQATAVTITSSNPLVATTLGAGIIPIGASTVDVLILTGTAGKAQLILRGGGQVREITIIVGSPAVGDLPPVLAPPVGAVVLPALTLGQIVLPELHNRSLSLPFLAGPVFVDTAVTITSSDPAVVDVTQATALVPAGTTGLTLNLVTASPGQARLTLRAGDQVRVFTVRVGKPVAGERAPTLARPVTVEVQP